MDAHEGRSPRAVIAMLDELSKEWTHSDKDELARWRDELFWMDRKRIVAAAALALKSYTLLVDQAVHLTDVAQRLFAYDRQTEASLRLNLALQPGAVRRQLSRNAVAAKLARDPKQAAKAQAYKLWQDWQLGSARFKSGAEFARHVVEVLPAIESTKVVERWVTQWRKGAKIKKHASS